MEVATSLQEPGLEATFEGGLDPNTNSLVVGSNILHNLKDSSDDSEIEQIKPSRKRIETFSSSDSETNTKTHKLVQATKPTFNNEDYSSSDNENLINTQQTKASRISKALLSSSDSDASIKGHKNEAQQNRMKNKRNNLQHKFKKFLSSRSKDEGISAEMELQESVSPIVSKSDSESCSDVEAASIERIKQKIKERTNVLKSTIYDPDTSDEDSNPQKDISRAKPRKKQKQPTSPKPVRMSAKQALENMQKIKSESNRMLREKDVSLPYHRPKALTLKDIMNRRKPAVSSDGKALPLKMNEEQLKLYAISLEQRQKEMIELCKSDTEEEEDINETDNNGDAVEAEKSRKITEQKDDHLPESKKESDKINETSLPMVLDSNVENPIEVTNTRNMLVLGQDSDQIEDSEEKKDSIGDSELIELSEQKVMNLCNDIKDNLMKDTLAGTATDSQFISLHYDSEKIENVDKQGPHITNKNMDNQPIIQTINQLSNTDSECTEEITSLNIELKGIETAKQLIEHNCILENYAHIENVDNIGKTNNDVATNGFSEDDFEMDDIDKIIENADIIQNIADTLNLNNSQSIAVNPKLAGTPGMVIDLDSPTAPKLSGVELLKERYSFFAKLKTPEELKRQRETKIKPGTQHLKLKLELEDLMAEQRSLEWAKRLEEEKQHRKELDVLRGDESDCDDEIDKIKSKLEDGNIDNEINSANDSSEAEEEPPEDDVEIKENPKRRNHLIADEAEESDCDDGNLPNDKENPSNDNKEENIDEEDNDDDKETNDDESSESSESSESDDELLENKPSKRRILKAFEDSDDDEKNVSGENEPLVGVKNAAEDNVDSVEPNIQDEELQSAQFQKSYSEDLFSQESENTTTNNKNNDATIMPNNHVSIPTKSLSNELSVICDTQSDDDTKLDHIAIMCSGSFSQNIIAVSATQALETQEIGDDVLALCTGKFYDNQFVSQDDVADKNCDDSETPIHKTINNTNQNDTSDEGIQKANDKKEANLLNSILLELDDPKFNEVQPNKFFCGDKIVNNKENSSSVLSNTQVKKKLIIDSDEEDGTENQTISTKKPKKKRRKKLEDRALQFSDDEDEISEADASAGEEESEIEDESERVVEYDSEENEVEVKQLSTKKQKRKHGQFFEQEAELTSEDEWAGSGDEDEAGLDRMEREAGDDDHFDQRQLRTELGQIHMRDVLDQDKRDVRLIQELLFEDGDLGTGHRQRKFRWRNADGEEETGTVPGEYVNSQEEEGESEEMWRKQRHERTVFLKQLQNNDEEEEQNVSINRTAIIKANLDSKTVSSLLKKGKAAEDNHVPEKKVCKEGAVKDLPSPVKKHFSPYQQSFRGSLLSRGSGALARLAALATPLAGVGDDSAPKVGSLKAPGKNNFVFAAVSPAASAEPKVSKRKAEANAGTPKLLKKLKIQDKTEQPRSRLIEHLT